MKKMKNKFYHTGWWMDSVLPFVRRKSTAELSRIYYSPERKPQNFIEEDWDNMLLLDGCRYDLFAETNTLGLDIDYRISLGSATPEFIDNNFSNSEYYDIVYVTANPMYRIQDIGDTFYDVIDVWESDWDDTLKTVPPEPMANATIEAYEKYPNKRILSHFMQPHYPFIGELADEIGDHSGYEFAYRQVTGEDAKRDDPTIWEMLEGGEVSRELVWAAYKENLEIALPFVKQLLDRFNGRTVVTSDHGNGLGERPFPFGKPIYGHPVGVRHDCLRKVPWLISEGETRRDIVAEQPTRREESASEEVVDRLADLGYADL